MSKRGQYILIAVLSVILAVNLIFVFVLESLQPAKTPTPPPTQSTTVPTDATSPSTLPTEKPTEAPTEPTSESFLLTFTGDSTLGTEEGWWDQSDNFINTIGTDYTYPFRNVASIFKKDDCTFTNFEGVLAEEGVGSVQDKRFRFRGPVAYTEILTSGSIEAVSLANNHSYDYGYEGLVSTKNALDGVGIKYAEHLSSVLFTTERGLTIGMYAINFIMDEDDMRQEVAQLRENGAEIVILALHKGDEGIYTPTDAQVDLAHTAIDAGVDIVWGHNPHVLQPIERYNGGVILYSLGNFSFGGNRNPKDHDTAIVQQQVIRDKDGNIHMGELSVIPCSISSSITHNNYQPTTYAYGTVAFNRVLAKLNGTFNGPDIPPAYADPTTPDPIPTQPTEAPTAQPTQAPTQKPTQKPTQAPTQKPTQTPTEAPTQKPTQTPTEAPTQKPTQAPTEAPTQKPSTAPTEPATQKPTQNSTAAPTEAPTEKPTAAPTEAATEAPAEVTEPIETQVATE